jgi:arylsulfatase A-like enzyme
VEIARKDFAQETGKSGMELDSWTEAFVKALPTEAPDVPDNVLYDGEMTDLAIRVLYALKEKRNPARPSEPAPFFLAVGYQKPHLPFIAPKKYWDLYDPNEIELADNSFPPKDAAVVGLHPWGELRGYTNIPKEGPLSQDQARRLRHGYYACVSFLDAQIGRLLDELDRLDLRKNTIVVFWGDHGWHLGEHDLWGKTSNFEHDTRSPLIISLPGKKKAGRSTDALVEFVDIYPSLCELAGLPLPNHLEGTSFVPLLDNPEKPWKSAAFSQYPRGNLMGYSMRTNRHRLTIWQEKENTGQVKAIELYDHQIDPAENVNIAARPENTEIVRELTDQLHLGWRAALPED